MKFGQYIGKVKRRCGIKQQWIKINNEFEANTLLEIIQDRVSASAGAACHASNVQMSAVLEAMGVTPKWGMGTVRFPLGA